MPKNITVGSIEWKRFGERIGREVAKCGLSYRELAEDMGGITYEVHDERPDSYRFVCGVSDDCGGNGYAKHDAEQIARGLNLLVQYGKEILPNVRDND